MDERTLYEQIRHGNGEALKELFHLHYRALCAYTVQLTKSMPEAEDIVQSVFVKLWDCRETLNITVSLKAYLYRSAYNRYVDQIRKDKRESTLLEALKYEAISHQLKEDDSLLQQKIEKTKKLIDTLPVRCKEIVLLSKQDGYKNKEIAKKLSISIKTVESQLRIAFQKIRDGFEDDEVFKRL